MSNGGESARPIVIAGAGIGGLAAALALRANGHDIIVMDKAPELGEVGAGLQLSPNACAVLDQLGLLEELEPLACAPADLRIWSGTSGRQLTTVRMGDFLRKRHGYPFWQVHRADLQQALLRKVRSTPGITVRLGCEVEDLTASPYEHLTCVFSHDDETGRQDCRALIGADGVWSKVRRLIPGHNIARFSGQVAYRTTVPIDAVARDWAAAPGLWLHRDSHLVHYPVRGGRDLNIVALAVEDWQDERWSTKADKDALLHLFRDWPTQVRNLLGTSDKWLKWALCSVDATGPWSHGNVALIGDAAHAMLPYMAQGAAMAIEDAAILAKHMPGDVHNIAAALRSFERERKSRVAHVQKTSFGNARTFHYSGALAFARDTALKLSSPTRLAARYDDIYGWTPDQ